MQIKYILINETLRNFYTIHEKEGNGVILNSKGGAFSHDLFEELHGKIIIEESIKKDIWILSKRYYDYYQDYSRWTSEQKTKALHEYFKARLIEYHLNILINTQNKKFEYTGTELPIILGIRPTDEEDIQRLREYKNSLDMAIFSLSPDEE